MSWISGGRSNTPIRYVLPLLPDYIRYYHSWLTKQLIAAYREDCVEPTRNSGTTSLFSLKQQAIVAQVKGSVTYMDVKTGRPTDIRSLDGGWPALNDELTRKAERANTLREKWEVDHPGKSKI